MKQTKIEYYPMTIVKDKKNPQKYIITEIIEEGKKEKFSFNGIQELVKYLASKENYTLITGYEKIKPKGKMKPIIKTKEYIQPEDIIAIIDEYKRQTNKTITFKNFEGTDFYNPLEKKYEKQSTKKIAENKTNLSKN